MDIQITFLNLESSPSLREYAARRFSTLERYFNRPGCRLHVELERPIGRKKPLFECRAIFYVPGGQLVIHKRAHDPHEAIDAAKKALRRVVDEWYDRVLLGARWPKKYFVAKLVEAREG